MKPYYDDGKIAIYHGDAREILPSVRADVLVSDPPYGMAYQSGWKASSNVANDGDTQARDAVIEAWGDKPAIIFGRWSVPRPPATRIVLYWDKGPWPGMGDLALPWGPSTEEIYVLGGGFVGKRQGQIIPCHQRVITDAVHPTQKPVDLMRALLQRCPSEWTVLRLSQEVLAL